ncbi:MAG: polysaccharide biosynthesis tyrosine autokinase [Candidatus Omnitrophota bacterium]|jgi:tyrosine-protein kinase Etk/Wzc
MIPAPGIKGLTARDYFDVVWKRRWIVVTCTVLMACYAFVTALTVSRFYQAKATVMVGKEDAEPQRVLLRSLTLSKRVIKRLSLDKSPRKLLSAIKIRKAAEGKGNIYEIAVTGREPDRITSIANVWARECIKLDKERKRAAAKEEIEGLEEGLSEARKNLLEDEEKLNTFTEQNRSVAEKSILVESLEGQVAQVKKDIWNLSTAYEDEHPKMVFLNTQLTDLSAKLKDEKADLLSVQDEVLQFQRFQRSIKEQKAISGSLAEEIQKKKLSESLIGSDIRLIDNAETPEEPLPVAWRIAYLSLMGLLFGAVVCYGLEYFDPTLKRAEEVEFYAKMPFLGYIPSVRKIVKSGKDVNLFSHLQPGSHVSEAFRNVKVAMIFATPEQKRLGVVGIISAAPEEGKTFVATNLAISFAHANEYTLLVDGNMRKGVLGKFFGLPTKPGLTEVLDGKCKLSDATKPTFVPNLSVLSSGSHVHNPTDLLSAVKFEDFMKETKMTFQRVIIDIPAVLNHTESLLWGNKCDGLVDVIGTGYTPLKDVSDTKEKLKGKATIVGAVLNNMAVEKDMEYYLHYFKALVGGKVPKPKGEEDAG